ncbi:hypothetical protein AwPolaro_07670 [Polaromonas sp.]|nr:hypothetical protein AwPolaro_07670 [Polaromonas sp.]
MLRKGWECLRQAGFTAALVLVCGLCGVGVYSGTAQAKEALGPSHASTITQAQLPVQGRDVLVLIYQGGPFRYGKDGTVFGNRERILPAHERGYYREYTVKTPAVRSRGARRIVCGGLQPAAPDACYYSDNHYASFRKITP